MFHAGVCERGQETAEIFSDQGGSGGTPSPRGRLPRGHAANRELGSRVSSGPGTPEGQAHTKTPRKEAASQFPSPGPPKCVPQHSRPRRGSYPPRARTRPCTHIHGLSWGGGLPTAVLSRTPTPPSPEASDGAVVHNTRQFAHVNEQGDGFSLFTVGHHHHSRF